MPSLKRSKKKDEAASAMPPPTADASAPPTLEVEAQPVAPPPAMAAEPSFQPAPPPPAPRGNGGGGNLVNRLYGPPGEQSASERQRVAEAEFQAAIAPALDLLAASVPEASSHQEAARVLEQRLGDYTPDPRPGSYVPGDAFETDARVYYRLLKRNYERNPRPSEKRQKSHHLHEIYGRLPGHKGW